MDKKYSNIWAIALAFLLAIAIVALVKYFLIPAGDKESGLTAHILWFEPAALIAVLTAFVLNEVVRVSDRILGRKNMDDGKASETAAKHISPFTLILVFGASVFIYLAAETWTKFVHG